MTAAAMRQDREECIAAGMNDHIAKPIEPKELAEALRRWIADAAACAPQQEPAQAAAAGPSALDVLDEPDADPERVVAALERALPGVAVRGALARMCGNAVLYRKLVRSFALQLPGVGERLRTSLHHGEYDALYRDAHNLKGSAGNLGLETIRNAADRLARDIRDGNARAEWPALTEALVQACEDAIQLLQAVSSGIEPPPVSSPTTGEGADEAAVAAQLALLNLLEKQLRERDFAARATAASINVRLAAASDREGWATVATAVAELRFAEALTALTDWRRCHDQASD